MRIKGKKVWILGQFMEAALEIDGGRITAVSLDTEQPADYDFGTDWVLPGFIDVHTHGAFGFDTNDAKEEGMRLWASRLPEEGVTAFCPTTVTDKVDTLTAALKNVAAVKKSQNPDGSDGAQILGAHLEGPFLSVKFKGAQPEECILSKDPAQLDRFIEASENNIRLMTVSVTEPEDLEFMRHGVNRGIRVSLGHTSADYSQAILGLANGASSMTHVHNGMPVMHHRSPGIVGAAYRLSEVYGEIICDGCHIHPAMLYNFFMAKGRDHGIMITDSLCAKGCKDGEIFYLGGHPYTVYPDGSAHLVEQDALAGSTLHMNQGLRILIEEAGIPAAYAINACTKNPAEYLGLHGVKGQLQAGYDADIAVIGREYQVVQTFCRGKAQR